MLASENMELCFVGFDGRVPTLGQVQNLLDTRSGVDNWPSKDSPSLLVQSVDKFGDDTKVASASTDGPIQIGVFLLVCGQDGTCSVDDRDLDGCD